MLDASVSRWMAVALATGSLTTGCLVPEQKYERAVRAADQEQSAHRRTAEQLYEVRQKLAYAEGLLDEQHAKLEAREDQLARRKLEMDRVATERDDAARMVDQLRGELGRVGDHLRAFSEQKHRLESALEDAEDRARELERAEEDIAIRIRMVRDLTGALSGALEAGSAAVTVAESNPVVELSADEVFADATSSLRPAGAAWLERVADALAPHERARLEITERPGAEQPEAESVIVRLQRVADRLSEAGFPFDRVTLSLPPEPSASPSETDGDVATGDDGAAAADPNGTEATPEGSEPTSAEPAADAPSRTGAGTLAITVQLAPRSS